MTRIRAINTAQMMAAPEQVHLRLLATTDLHAHLLPYDYYTGCRGQDAGLAHLADLIAAAREGVPNSLLFDNGDTLQGTPLADATQAQMLPEGRPNPMITAMNALGFDAGTLGNHDFDFGLEFLEASLSTARFPVTLANARRCDGTDFLPRRIMLKKRVTDGAGQAHDLRVGVVGALPPQVAAWSQRHVESHLTFDDITTSVAQQVKDLREQRADIVVVLAHSGMGDAFAPEGAENVALQLAELPGVDAVFAGHTHDLGVRAPTQTAAPIAQPAAYGTHLGLIDLMLNAPDADGRRSVEVVQTATPKATGTAARTRRLLGGQADLRQEVARAHRTTRAYVERPLGHSAVALETFFSTLAPCAATQLVADAQCAAAAPLLAAKPELAGLPILSAAAPFRAGGRSGPANYTDIAAGALQLRHAADLYIYPNALSILRIDGAGLLEWLERCASIYHQIDPDAQTPQTLIDRKFASYNFDRITGLRYRFDVSQPPRTDAEGAHVDPSACRVRDLCFADGRSVQPSDQAIILTNSYRAAGGRHMPAAGAAEVLATSSDTVRDTVAQFIAQADVAVAPRVDPTFSFVPLGGVPVVFETGPAADHHKDRLAELGLRPTGRGLSPQGFAQFSLTL